MRKTFLLLGTLVLKRSLTSRRSDSSSRRPGSLLPRRTFRPTRCRSSSPLSRLRREWRNTATQAPGSASHVSCILFNAAIGVDIVAVPYRGLGLAMQDLTAAASTICAIRHRHRSRRSTAASSRRSPQLASSAGTRLRRCRRFVSMGSTSSQGLFLAQNTPEAIVRELNAATEQGARPAASAGAFHAARRTDHAA